MKKYELITILRVSENVESLKDNVKDIIQKHGVKVESEDAWGIKKMAYEIDNEQEGYYYILIIESPPEAIRKFSDEFQLNSDILRYLPIIIKKEKSTKGKQNVHEWSK